MRLLGLATLAVLAWRMLAIPQLGITLYIDEAQYWTWAQALDWGYFSKPPGVAGLIAASTALFGDGLLGVKALAMLCYPATAWLTYAVARRLADEQVAFWSALIVLTLPIYGWLGLFVSTDALLTLFWMAALLTYLRALEHDRWGDWLLLGACCGLGLMSKYTMVAWMLAAALHLGCYHRQRLASAKLWVAILLALAILSPNIVWNIAHDFPTLRHTADITVNKRAHGGFKALAEFWSAQWVAFGPLFGSVLLALLATARSSWKNEKLRLLLWFALPLWAVVSVQAFKTSANANWAAPAFAPAAIAVTLWLLERGRQRWLQAGLAFNVLIVAVVMHGHSLFPGKLDPFARARGWDTLGQQLAPVFAAHPDAVLVADNRTLLAHLSYELREQHPAVASWNPEGAHSDHYKLTTDLKRYAGHPLIFVTRDPLPASATRFTRPEVLPPVRTDLGHGRELALNVYLLHDFQGY